MRMPGFTAQTSLYETHEHYRLAGGLAEGTGGQAVIPQLCWWVGGCVNYPIIGRRRLRCCTSWWPPFMRCRLQAC